MFTPIPLLFGNDDPPTWGPLPSAQATPELDSWSLFGSGLVGMAGYALARWRSGRKSRGDKGLDAENDDDQA